VCRELDDAMRLYHGLPDLLSRVAAAEASRVPSFLRGRGVEDNLHVVYLPRVGYAVRIDGSTLPPDIADELRDFEFAFDDENATEGTYHAYYFTKARPGHHTGPHTTSLAGCTPILKDYR
jgi:DNA mismatch repair protein MSH5